MSDNNSITMVADIPDDSNVIKGSNLPTPMGMAPISPSASTSTSAPVDPTSAQPPQPPAGDSSAAN